MIFDLQRANVGKRISAFLFDAILLSILAVGFAYLISNIVGYDRQTQALETIYNRYAQEYGVSFDISEEEYAELSEAEQAAFAAANEALSQDAEAGRLYTLILYLTLIIVSIGLLLGFIVLEFVVPLFLGHGRTLGKKIFGICLMQTNSTKLRPIALFARTVLGKYAIETMIPAAVLLVLYFGEGGRALTIGLIAFLLLQILVFALTKKHSAIHDLLAQTVCVDYESQKIFDTVEERDAYIERINREKEEIAAGFEHMV